MSEKQIWELWELCWVVWQSAGDKRRRRIAAALNLEVDEWLFPRMGSDPGAIR